MFQKSGKKYKYDFTVTHNKVKNKIFKINIYSMTLKINISNSICNYCIRMFKYV